MKKNGEILDWVQLDPNQKEDPAMIKIIDGSVYLRQEYDNIQLLPEEVAALLHALSNKTAPLELLEALKLILPMAKGYAHAHDVGSNSQYIQSAEEAISNALSTAD